MAVLAADHYIADGAGFRQVLVSACRAALDDHLVTLGIKPSSPSTGFGYIHQGESLGMVAGLPLFRVERFTEKPDLATAERMIESGDYSWNSGMFIWRVERILEEFKHQMSDFFNQLAEVEAALTKPDYWQTLEHVWPKVTKQTIDYGIIEGAADVAVFPVEIGWADIGSWGSLLSVLPADEDGNIWVGPHIAMDTHDTLAFGDKRLIVTIGVQGLVIVDTQDSLLVCPKEREQEVRNLVDLLKREGLDDYL
jgi:mannose-1-phosphate guanylyltransferase